MTDSERKPPEITITRVRPMVCRFCGTGYEYAYPKAYQKHLEKHESGKL